MNKNNLINSVKNVIHSLNTKISWVNYLKNKDNFGHVERILIDNKLENHINECLNSSYKSVLRINNDTKFFKPKFILEIGSSAGFICIQAKNFFPEAKVIGIEPEKQAIEVANNMSKDFKLNNLSFVNGVGECLPFKNNQFDLIICHTVIEHVKNVEQVIFEMERVLNPKGYIHLEAPNYYWPYEPHLQVWCIPSLGKKSVKLLSKIQKNSPNTEFVNHLQFVNPTKIEKVLKKLSLDWENLTIKKIIEIMEGNDSKVKSYIKLSKFLYFLNKLKLKNFILRMISFFKIYPSLMYLITKK